MRINHWNLGHREGDDIVVVNPSGSPANVRLLGNANCQSYKTGRSHKYYDGQITRSLSKIPIPSNGIRHAVADMQGLRGQSRIGIRMDPRVARQPLPRYQPPHLAPIAQAIRKVPTALTNSHPTTTKTYDVFISYAAEDKDEVAHPLAVALEQRGLSVWYDEFELRIGDRLRSKIDDGIVRSRFGVVVLSEHFFAKGWPQYELDGILTRHGASAQNILPIWHQVTKEYIIDRSPSLAGVVALITSTLTIEKIAAEIAGVIRDRE